MYGSALAVADTGCSSLISQLLVTRPLGAQRSTKALIVSEMTQFHVLIERYFCEAVEQYKYIAKEDRKPWADDSAGNLGRSSHCWEPTEIGEFCGNACLWRRVQGPCANMKWVNGRGFWRQNLGLPRCRPASPCRGRLPSRP